MLGRRNLLLSKLSKLVLSLPEIIIIIRLMGLIQSTGLKPPGHSPRLSKLPSLEVVSL